MSRTRRRAVPQVGAARMKVRFSRMRQVHHVVPAMLISIKVSVAVHDVPTIVRWLVIGQGEMNRRRLGIMANVHVGLTLAVRSSIGIFPNFPRNRLSSSGIPSFLLGPVIVQRLAFASSLTRHPAVRSSWSLVDVQVGTLEPDRLASIALHRRGLRIRRVGSNAFNLDI